MLITAIDHRHDDAGGFHHVHLFLQEEKREHGADDTAREKLPGGDRGLAAQNQGGSAMQAQARSAKGSPVFGAWRLSSRLLPRKKTAIAARHRSMPSSFRVVRASPRITTTITEASPVTRLFRTST
jgi:hypothetical protein